MHTIEGKCRSIHGREENNFFNIKLMKLLMIVIVSGGYMLEPINVPDNKSCEQVYNEKVKIIPNPKYTDGNGENWVVIKWGDKKVMGYICK